MAYTYILYSKFLDTYYTGACNDDLEKRIKKHINHQYGSHRFTAQTDDWSLYLSFKCVDYAHAIRLERKIKAIKSRKFIINLTKYPELRAKIIDETKGPWLSR